MGARDVLVAEVGASVAILGLLLVFLPLMLEAVDRASQGKAPAKTRKRRTALAWVLPATIATAASGATTGLLTLWGVCDLGEPTGVLLLLTMWLVVGLAFVSVSIR